MTTTADDLASLLGYENADEFAEVERIIAELNEEDEFINDCQGPSYDSDEYDDTDEFHIVNSTPPPPPLPMPMPPPELEMLMFPQCKFGKGCNRVGCMFSHPVGFVIPSSICWDGIYCRKAVCLLSHPLGFKRTVTPCRYGADCTRKSICTFAHPNA